MFFVRKVEKGKCIFYKNQIEKILSSNYKEKDYLMIIVGKWIIWKKKIV